jgi:hypothetical protein
MVKYSIKGRLGDILVEQKRNGFANFLLFRRVFPIYLKAVHNISNFLIFYGRLDALTLHVKPTTFLNSLRDKNISYNINYMSKY